MAAGQLTQNTVTASSVSTFEHRDDHADASYDQTLAKREVELLNALAELQALRRHQGDVMQMSGGILRALFISREAAASRIAGLTPRQREVLELILAGRPNKIIAWELGISQRTVENHRALIMKTTGSKSVPALARLAIAAAWNGASQQPGEDRSSGNDDASVVCH